MTALSIALAYLGTLAFAAFWAHERPSPRVVYPDVERLVARIVAAESEVRTLREKLEAREIAGALKGRS